MQELSEKKSVLRRLENLLPRKNIEKKQKEEKFRVLLSEYYALTGTPLIEGGESALVQHPAKWLELLQELSLKVDSSSDEFSVQLNKLEKIQTTLFVELRSMEVERKNVQSSINYAIRYSENIDDLSYPQSADDVQIECPFCHSDTTPLVAEINKLDSAVKWLNTELRKSPYMKESFQSNENKIDSDIKIKKAELLTVNNEIRALENQINKMSKRQSIRDSALKIKLKIENYLEDLLDNPSKDIEDEIKEIKKSIKVLKDQIKEYRLDIQMANIEEFINKSMNSISENLDFEASYKPLNLKFLLKNFDLWNTRADGKKVFLRSMGSGANWLYCHLVLFISLQKLFCKLGDKCKIPPILFLDQPSQVYFPNISRDNKTEFSPEELAPIDKVGQSDDDIKCVERFFSEIAIQCDTIETETGQMPQIIISDHVDGLNLEEEYDFENFVRARWRTRGFIELSPSG
ncbi:MAG: DUF3732 domain-containing protein [Magnetovibrio sp.]|nr:DUF3732 domain-containing protein [Magnetovibrio sp.]